MKEQLSTAIDFYLETQKTNPFIMHLSSNASSRDLIQLRNCAFILNKLTLLNLEHPKEDVLGASFEDEFVELYGVNIQAIINNSLMPYKDFDSVRDLVCRIQHLHFLLSKLTFIPTGEQSDSLRRKVSINSFWPRIRAWMIAIEEKIPQNYPEIRQHVTIRRGLLETDKKYFVSQMMAKKIQTKGLKDLIAKYQKQMQNHSSSTHSNQISQVRPKEKHHQAKTWGQVKKCVRMIPLTNQVSDWTHLYQFLISEQFKQLHEAEKQEIRQYIKDVLDSDLFESQEPQIENKNNNHLTISRNIVNEEKINLEKIKPTEIKKNIQKIINCNLNF